MVRKKEMIKKGLKLMEERFLTPSKEGLKLLKEIGVEKITDKTSLKLIVGRADFTIDKLDKLIPETKEFLDEVKEQLIIHAKYDKYIEKQEEQIKKMHEMLKVKIPEDMRFDHISGLSNEIKEKLERFKPPTLQAASQISGVTPAAIEILHIYIKMAEKGKK